MQTVKPVYRIGAAGLDPRDWRLIEIVFKHSQYNRFEFVLAPGAEPELIDILIANTNDADGVRAVSAVRTGTRSIPVIAAVPRGSPGAGRHAISIDRLTLQLLPILNRVVELELLRRETVPPESVDSSNAPKGPKAPTVVGEQPIIPDNSATLNLPLQPLQPLQPSPTATRLSDPADSFRATGAIEQVSSEQPKPVRQAVDQGPGSTSNAVTALSAVSAKNEEPVALISPHSAFRTREPNPANPVSVVPSEDQRPRAGTEEASLPIVQEAPKPPLSTRPSRVPPRKLDLPASPPNLKAVPTAMGAGPVGAPAAAPDPSSSNSNLFAFPKSHLSPPAPQQLRVLVVDDSPTVRQQLTGAIQRMGLACVVVSSAADALKCLEEQYFDLILLDVVMPDMDGYKLTRLIKRNRQFRQIPIVLLTSRSSALDLARGMLAGCDTYLVKPVSLQALETAVFKQLRNSLAIDDLSTMLRPTDAAPSLVALTPAVTPAATPANAASTRTPDDQTLARR